MSGRNRRSSRRYAGPPPHSNAACCAPVFAYPSADRCWRSPRNQRTPMADLSGADAPAEFALSIVIPVYNGADSVGELIAALEVLDIPGRSEERRVGKE